MTDWNSVQSLVASEFNPSNLITRIPQFLSDPCGTIQQTDPLILCLYFAIVYAFGCWILGLLTDKYSWVDKSWSILPAVYAWFFALSVPLSKHHYETSFDLLSRLKNLLINHPRPLIMAILPTIWSVRLTYNFARKGGYKYDGEDYRWKHIQGLDMFKSVPGKILWHVFAFAFIALYQNILLVCFASPAYVAYKDAADNLHKKQGLTLFDVLLIVAWIVLVGIETIADRQQWDFYARRDKYRSLNRAEQESKKLLYGDEIRGFNTRGLFSYSRHPNFFAEQSLWVVYYLFSVVITNNWLHWTLQGPFQLIFLIFMGSTRLTEQITASKYPAYKIYQKYVPMTIPRFTPAKINWSDKQE